jgi:UDP-GlcNAc:undecaprenyl-phosphate GlcNAc-1-phosphate transferase
MAGAAACLALLMFGIKRLGYHEFVEAGAVVGGSASRLRRSIRDGIHARDVAHVIALGESPEHLRAILADNAEVLGFVHLGFCRESAADGGRAELPPESARRAWKLDFPVAAPGCEGTDPWVLRAWCDPADPRHAPSPSRTARILAEAIRHWLEQGPPPIPAPAPTSSPASAVGSLRNAPA